MKMLLDYRFVDVVLLCVLTFSSTKLYPYVVVSANSTDTSISQDASEMAQKMSTEDVSNEDDDKNVTTCDTALNRTSSNEITLRPFDNVNTTGAQTVSVTECVIDRGWFRWKIHLQAGHSYFSSSDCVLEVCNEKGNLDLYSCNRLDAWDVLRPSIDREVNEAQLQCLKSGCI